MKNKLAPAGALIFIAALALTGCGQQAEKQAGAQAKAAPAQEAQVFAVATTRAVEGQINDYLELSGDVQTLSSVDVYADTAGKLTQLRVRVGDRVVKDQVIAEVDPSRPGSTFVASPVKAPIGGTISSIPAQIGATISQGVPVVKIATTDQLEIRTSVVERFISRIRVGLDAVVAFEAYPSLSFRARVSEVSPVVDPVSRTMEVKLLLVEPDRRIKPGMFAGIKIITEKKSGIVKIPAECLVNRFGQSYVFVVVASAESPSGFIVERTPVVPGIQIDEKLEIVNGLQAGAEVVIQGQTLLEDRSSVKVANTVAPLEASDLIR